MCLWHVCKNVAFEAKKKWAWPGGQAPAQLPVIVNPDSVEIEAIGEEYAALLASVRQDEPEPAPALDPGVPDTPKGFMALWKVLCYTTSQHECQAAWDVICDKFSGQQALLTYVESTYFPYKSAWAMAWTRWYQNYRQLATCRTEGNHKQLKTYLVNSTADFFHLNHCIEQMINHQQDAFRSKEVNEAILQPVDFNTKK